MKTKPSVTDKDLQEFYGMEVYRLRLVHQGDISAAEHVSKEIKKKREGYSKTSQYDIDFVLANAFRDAMV